MNVNRLEDSILPIRVQEDPAKVWRHVHNIYETIDHDFKQTLRDPQARLGLSMYTGFLTMSASEQINAIINMLKLTFDQLLSGGKPTSNMTVSPFGSATVPSSMYISNIFIGVTKPLYSIKENDIVVFPTPFDIYSALSAVRFLDYNSSLCIQVRRGETVSIPAGTYEVMVATIGHELLKSSYARAGFMMMSEVRPIKLNFLAAYAGIMKGNESTIPAWCFLALCHSAGQCIAMKTGGSSLVEHNIL